jgi:hypothetical protein
VHTFLRLFYVVIGTKICTIPEKDHSIVVPDTSLIRVGTRPDRLKSLDSCIDELEFRKEKSASRRQKNPENQRTTQKEAHEY